MLVITLKLCLEGNGLLPGLTVRATCQPAALAASASAKLSVANMMSDGLSTPNDSAMS